MAVTETIRASRPPVRVGRHHPAALLPYGWPLYALCYGYPLWWILGLAEFIWPVFGFFMLLSLTMRRDKIRFPKGFGLYLLFMAWMIVSAVNVSGSDKLIGFAYRLGLYSSAPLFGLYVFNAPKHALPNKAVVRAMFVFWVVVVGGGLLGLALPHLQITTLVARVLPGRLQNNPFVFNLVHPKTAQIQTFLGFPVPRPAAPFVFTNDWGGNFALLVPFVLAYWSENKRIARSGITRLLVPLSLLPVIFSLNRTLWACLGLIALYGGIRFGARQRVMAVIRAGFIVAVLGAAVFAFGPTHQLIAGRVEHPHSNQGRSILYNQSISLALQKPLLGYGGPQQSTTATKSSTYKHPDVGTQGQFWTVLVSNGMPATFFFFGYFFYAMWQTRRAKSPLALWCHIVVLVALFQSPFYGLLASQIHLVFIAIALAYRESCDPDPSDVRPSTPVAAPVPVTIAAAPTTNGRARPLHDDDSGARPWGSPAI
jgi:polysaccharide biosynthesis protein PslJ